MFKINFSWSIHLIFRHFKLHLHSAKRLLTRDFKVLVVGENETREEDSIDRRDFYEGNAEGMQGSFLVKQHNVSFSKRFIFFQIAGFENSRVNVHWIDDDVTAVIHTEQDTFVVEVRTSCFIWFKHRHIWTNDLCLFKAVVWTHSRCERLHDDRLQILRPPWKGRLRSWVS